MCDTAYYLICHTSEVRYFQGFSIVSPTWCKPNHSLFILALCMADLEWAEDWNHWRSVPTRCAYSSPLQATCIGILTPSHSVPTLYSSFVEVYVCPIVALAPITSTSNHIWSSLVWRVFRLSSSNQYLSHASVTENSPGINDVLRTLIFSIFSRGILDKVSYPFAIITTSGVRGVLKSNSQWDQITTLSYLCAMYWI